MAYDTPFHTATPVPAAPAGASTKAAVAMAPAASASAAVAPTLTALPLRQQLRIGFRDMATRSWSMARSFGTIGALYSGVECGIEGFRAKNDMTNAVLAGCVTGGIMARNSGPQGVLVGCAGFAAFSLAIETYLRSPEKDD